MRHWLRFSRLALGPAALAMAGLLATGPAAYAQSPEADADSPARFIPATNLVMYGEFEGLDAHAGGWQKTAAYRVLNETPTGAMLEDLFLQIYPRMPFRDLTAAEALLVFKHVAKSGIMISENAWGQDGAKRSVNALILRNAFGNKDVRPIFARLLQGMAAPGTKSQAVVRAGHKMVSGKLKDGDTFFWWVEETRKTDVIVVFGIPEAADYLIDVIEGKQPSALTNANRIELTKSRDGFERTGSLMMDPELYRAASPTDSLVVAFDRINAKRFDFTSGFQGDALSTVTRFHRKSAAAADKSILTTFDKTTIPVIPSGALGFTVLALDMKAIPAQVRQIKQISDQYDQFVATLKSKAKVRLEEDVFGQLGPKVTVYAAPAKAGAPSSPALPNALSLLTKMGAGGADALPKVAILIDVANPTAFGKTLDELMGYVNRQLKTSFAPPPGAAGPGNEGGGPPPGGPRGRGPGGPGGPPAPEFRVMLAGETKSYVFTVPPELSGAFPAGVRPTIRVGPKQVAIAVSADVARQALEAKGAYAPPPEITAAFGRVPSKLNWLMVHDPRDSTPQVLASLPAKLQAGVNMLMIAAGGGQAAAAPAAAAPAGGPGPRSGNSGMPQPETVGGGSSARPAAPGAPAGGAGAAPAAGGALVFQIDPAKLPVADDIKKLLFPAIYTLDTDGDVIRFTTRAAFPPIPDPSLFALFAAPGIQAARAAAARQQTMGAPANTPPRNVTDGFFDVPARDAAPGAAPTPTPAPESDRAGRPGGNRRGGPGGAGGRMERP